MAKKGIVVVSVCDGIACARMALKKEKIPVKKYYASEIEMEPMLIAQKNNPDIVEIGDIEKIKTIPEQVDLLIGGTPCQDLSIAKSNRKDLAGDRSKIFWDYVKLLKKLKPKYFVLENVASMAKDQQDIISKTLGVQPIMINAALLSAQNRKRLFWTNIPGVKQPEDKGVVLNDVLIDAHSEDLKSLCITASYHKKTAQDYFKKRSGQIVRIGQIGNGGQGERIYGINGKSVALSANGGGRGAKTGLYLIQRPRGKNKGGVFEKKSPALTSSSFEHNNHIVNGEVVRKLHPIECERLQGLPDGYTEGVCNTSRYQVLGDAFNVDVVAHILSFIKKQN